MISSIGNKLYTILIKKKNIEINTHSNHLNVANVVIDVKVAHIVDIRKSV
jgi:hypothetical protein